MSHNRKSPVKKFVVMQILPALESGGVERGTVDVAKALKKDGFEPIVVSKGGVLVYQLKEDQINHITLPVHSKNPFIIFRNIKKIENLIEENKVDVIHVRSRAPMWSAYFACKRTGVKLVSTVHGTYSLKFSFWSNFLPKRAYNAVMLRADRIIVASNFIKKYLIGNYQGKVKEPLDREFMDRVSLIPRGVELDVFDVSKVSKRRVIDLVKKWRLSEDKKIIMLPARFTSWKGHEFLIDALAQVKGEFCCIFVGSDHGHEKFRKDIEDKISKVGLAGKVGVVGICKDMAAAYAISNIVISSSVRPEAFGRVAIEAQAMERIIIATNIGGSLETIIDKKTGFLVEVNDAKQLAQVIDRALNLSEEESREIGKAARRNIEDNFSNKKMCEDTIDVYRSLLPTS